MTHATSCAHHVPTRNDVDQACDDPLVIHLVTRARAGDKRAWDALVERYAPLIWSICRKYRLSRDDADDVGQSAWMRLVDQLDKIRDPAALPGWLATTTRRECGRLVRAAHAQGAAVRELHPEIIPDVRAEAVEQDLRRAEPPAARPGAFSCLPPAGQRFFAMPIADPPVAYAEISARLGL